MARPPRSTAQRLGSRTDAFEATTNVELQVVDRGGEPEERDAAVEQQRDRARAGPGGR